MICMKINDILEFINFIECYSKIVIFNYRSSILTVKMNPLNNTLRIIILYEYALQLNNKSHR